MRLCSISVDLDEIHHYRAIHGLPVESPGAHAIYERALPRFRDFAAARHLPLTFFAVGADLRRDVNARRLRELCDEGHEIANHSLDHLYDLSRRSPGEIESQIAAASELIAARTGRAPVGFRAPGYVMSDAVYDALERLGVAYSSSVFPCPPYYLAKLLALAGKRLLGRVSESVLDSPRVLGAPTSPYHAGKPYTRKGTGVLELPVQVTKGLRLPFIGTTLTLLGPVAARRMARSLVGTTLVNLELHGIDLLDRDDDLEELSRHQPDLRVPLEDKWRTLEAVVDELGSAGYRFVRLDEAARQIEATACA